MRYGRMATYWLGLGHVLMSTAFFALGLRDLGIFNLGSVGLFVVASALVSRGRIDLAKTLCVVEMTAHALLVIYWIGWDAGFQMYLLLIAPAIFSDFRFSVRRKSALTLALMVLYVVLDLGVRPLPPRVVLSPALIDAFRSFNNVGVIFGLAYMMYWYADTASTSERHLNRLATVDPLTGLGNRRHLDELAAQVMRSASENGPPFSLIAADIDHFKQVNDQHGHAIGDEVLQAVGAALVAETRDQDRAIRLGGEEFLLLLPETGPETAMAIARRLADGVRRLRVPPLERGVTCTFGVAAWRPGESFDDCASRADRALYEGKRSGRDRVVLAA